MFVEGARPLGETVGGRALQGSCWGLVQSFSCKTCDQDPLTWAEGLAHACLRTHRSRGTVGRSPPEVGVLVRFQSSGGGAGGAGGFLGGRRSRKGLVSVPSREARSQDQTRLCVIMYILGVKNRSGVPAPPPAATDDKNARNSALGTLVQPGSPPVCGWWLQGWGRRLDFSAQTALSISTGLTWTWPPLLDSGFRGRARSRAAFQPAPCGRAPGPQACLGRMAGLPRTKPLDPMQFKETYGGGIFGS